MNQTQPGNDPRIPDAIRHPILWIVVLAITAAVIAALVLTVSDSIHAGEREDKAGTLAAAALVAHGWEVQRAQAPDELDAIRAALELDPRSVGMIPSTKGSL